MQRDAMEILLVLLGVLCLILFWIMLHDTTQFETTEYTVTDPRIKKPFRAVFLSDLHGKRFGRDNALLLQAIREGKPDLVLLGGDILTARPREDFSCAVSLVSELAKDFPVCYGVGKHEYRLKLYRKVYGDMGKEYDAALKEVGVRMMRNEKKDFDDLGISVVGSQINARFYKRCHKQEMRSTYLPRLLGTPDEEKLTILLAHNPEYFPEYAAWHANLVLSGHVHGGVVRIPFWNKGLISPSIKLFPKYDGGLFWEGKSCMLLSRGLGSHTIPVRLFNPGDLIFLSFCPGEEFQVEKMSRKKKQDMVK